MKTQKWYDAMAKRRGKGTNQFTKAKEEGRQISTSEETRKKISKTSKGRKVSAETRERISKSMKKFIKENPDKVPYILNHKSKGPSYPEIIWKGILISRGICFEEQFKQGSYSLDFALLDKKIDLEIDGEQHYTDERIVLHDQKRTEYLSSIGWKVIRVRWSQFCSLSHIEKENFILKLISDFAPITQLAE